MDILSILTGAVGVGAIYFLYLAASRGVPAAIAWTKAKWNAGRDELATLKSGIERLETGSIADLQARVDRLEELVAPLENSGSSGPVQHFPVSDVSAASQAQV